MAGTAPPSRVETASDAFAHALMNVDKMSFNPCTVLEVARGNGDLTQAVLLSLAAATSGAGAGEVDELSKAFAALEPPEGDVSDEAALARAILPVANAALRFITYVQEDSENTPGRVAAAAIDTNAPIPLVVALRLGADPDALMRHNNQSMTLLEVAVVLGHASCVRVLLAAGASPDEVPVRPDKRMALEMEVMAKVKAGEKRDIFTGAHARERLLPLGREASLSPMTAAAATGRTDIVEALVAAGACPWRASCDVDETLCPGGDSERARRVIEEARETVPRPPIRRKATGVVGEVPVGKAFEGIAGTLRARGVSIERLVGVGTGCGHMDDFLRKCLGIPVERRTFIDPDGTSYGCGCIFAPSEEVVTPDFATVADALAAGAIPTPGKPEHATMLMSILYSFPGDASGTGGPYDADALRRVEPKFVVVFDEVSGIAGSEAMRERLDAEYDCLFEETTTIEAAFARSVLSHAIFRVALFQRK